MKKVLKAGLFAFLFTMAYSAADAQIYVNVRPTHRVIVRRPPAPSPAHVWVNEDWRNEGGRYVWHGGYYAAPPRPGMRYVAGHWDHTRRGHVWIAATWR